jgi:hypothetical protein
MARGRHNSSVLPQLVSTLYFSAHNTHHAGFTPFHDLVMIYQAFNCRSQRFPRHRLAFTTFRYEHHTLSPFELGFLCKGIVLQPKVKHQDVPVSPREETLPLGTFYFSFATFFIPSYSWCLELFPSFAWTPICFPKLLSICHISRFDLDDNCVQIPRFIGLFTSFFVPFSLIMYSIILHNVHRL